jgi:hypothetical protein
MREPSSAKRLPSLSNRVKSSQACQVWATYLKSSSSRFQSNQTNQRSKDAVKGRTLQQKSRNEAQDHRERATASLCDDYTAEAVIRQGAAEQIFSATSKWKLCQICSLPLPAVFPALVESPTISTFCYMEPIEAVVCQPLAVSHTITSHDRTHNVPLLIGVV